MAPTTDEHYPPSMRNLAPRVRHKVVEIANAALEWLTQPPSWKLHGAIALALSLALLDRAASYLLDIDRIVAANAGEGIALIVWAISY